MAFLSKNLHLLSCITIHIITYKNKYNPSSSMQVIKEKHMMYLIWIQYKLNKY